MRYATSLLAILLALGAGTPSPNPNDPEANKPQTPFRLVDARPIVVLHEIPRSIDASFLTVTGVVFSRSPIEGVSVLDRAAMIRPAEPEDLVRIDRVPQGVADAPFRTYFEVPDAALDQPGVNGLEIRARTVDGRESNIHRVSVIRTTKAKTSK